MVEVLESSIVAPSEETPRHKIWLSNLDLVAACSYTPIIYFYRQPTGEPGGSRVGGLSAGALKAALAKALVPFYPLAGRLSRDATGRVEINCTGDGALFIAARSSSTIDDFNDFAPSAEARAKFVPAAASAEPPCIMLMLQATYLKCGGLILGVGVHHYALDGRGYTLFIRTFAGFTRGDISGIPAPFLDRTLLCARSTPRILFDHHDYSSTVFLASGASPVITSILKLSKHQIQFLKSSCSSIEVGNRVSTFRAIVAYIWRCSCIARQLPPDIETQLYLPVDLRTRLKPPLPPTYIGNPTIRTKAVARVDDLMLSPIKFGADKIKSAMDKVTNEYIRSLVDYLELMDLEVLSRRGGLPITSLLVVSWLSLPMYDIDFGWGRPAFLARAQMYGSGTVCLIKNPEEDGGVMVMLGMEPENMQRFKKIFYHPLSSFL